MRVNIENLEDYAKKEPFIVARYSPETKKLWFWGAWRDRKDAERVVQELENGVLVENDEINNLQ